MKILDRYVISEMLGPFLFGVATFTLLFVSADLLFRVARMIAEQQAALSTGVQYLLSSLPAVLVLTFPMSVLLSALLSFGRFSGESEIVAIKAGGISFLRVAVPGILLTLAISVVALYISEYISPRATYTANNILFKQLTREADQIKENLSIPAFAGAGGIERRATARTFDPVNGIMKNVSITDYQNNTLVRFTFADRAVWRDNRWILIDGVVVDFDPTKETSYNSHFDTAEMYLATAPEDLNRRPPSPDEMNRADLLKEIKTKEKDWDPRTLRKNWMKYFQKISIPFSCLVFGLIGIPLGLRPHRTSTSIGLGISIVMIFIYYVFMSVGNVLGEGGYVPYIAAAWLPNLIFGGVGVYLISRATQQ